MKRHASFGLLAFLFAVTLMLASCAGAGSYGGEQQGGSESEEDMQNINHGDMDSGSAASEMLIENGEESDERFIDAMIPHHQGAVEMAQVALESAEHPELRQLAET